MKKIIIFSLLTFIFSSGLVFAQIDTDSNGSQGIDSVSLGQTENANQNFSKLQNPLAGGGIDSIPKLVRAILDIVLTIAVPIIAVAIIYTGYLFIAAQGNPEKLKSAKQTLLYVLIGAGILLAAYVIAEAIESTIRAITG